MSNEGIDGGVYSLVAQKLEKKEALIYDVTLYHWF